MSLVENLIKKGELPTYVQYLGTKVVGSDGVAAGLGLGTRSRSHRQPDIFPT